MICLWHVHFAQSFISRIGRAMRIRSIIGVLVAAALGVIMPVRALQGQQDTVESNVPSETLKQFLRSYLNRGQLTPDKTTRITVVSVKTKEKATQEQIVYVSGQGWCGSGGCTLLILEPGDSSFKVLGRVTIVQPPVRLLPSMAHGYPDIGVRVQGGGIQPGYEAVLSFDGTTYPNNPSLPPARRMKSSQGKEIITGAENSFPLYD